MLLAFTTVARACDLLVMELTTITITSVISIGTPHVQTSSSDVVQVDERNAVDQQAQLLAFDRQNHMGASDRLASNLQLAIAEEADAQMQDKRVVNSAVNIAENKHKMKVCFFQHSLLSP